MAKKKEKLKKARKPEPKKAPAKKMPKSIDVPGTTSAKKALALSKELFKKEIEERDREKEATLISQIATRFLEIGKKNAFLTPSHGKVSEAISAAHNGECLLRLEDLLRSYDYNFVSDVAGICRTINVPSGKLLAPFWPKFAIYPPPEKRMTVALYSKEDAPKSLAAIMMKVPIPKQEEKEKTAVPRRGSGTASAASSGGGERRKRGGDARIKLLKTSNPRKEGTWGWKTWNILKTGMLLSEALKKGARINDIRWDEDKKNLELEPV